MKKVYEYIRLILVFGILVFVEITALSQTTIHISLADAIDRMSLNSPAALVEKLSFENDILQYENYQKGFLPAVSVSMSPFSFNRSIVKLQQADNGQYNYVEDYSSSSSTGLSIQQKVPFTGGNLSISTSLNYLNEFSQKRRSFSTTPFSISYSQQLFGGRKTMRMEKTIEYKKNEENIRNYCIAVSEIQQKTLGYFMDAFTAKLEKEISISNSLLTDSLYNLAKVKYKNNRITELNFKQIELQASNNKYLAENAIKKYEEAVRAMITYLGLTNEFEDIEIKTPEFDLPLQIDLEMVKYYADKNNPSSLSYRIKRLEARKSLYSTILENRFNADISASYGMNQYAENIRDAYSNPSRQQSVSISFSIPLSLWGINRNKVRIAKNEYRSSMISIDQEMDEFDNGIREKVNNYNHNVNLWFIAERSYELSQEQYKLTAREFAMGRASAYEFISSQQEQSSAVQKYYDAVRSVWESYFVLRER